MENKDMDALLKTLGEANQYMYPHFASREEMKAYYLQMNEFMNYGMPPATSPKDTDFRRLRRKLKQYIDILSELNEHQWGDEISELATAGGGYMMLKNTDFYKKMEINQAVGKHIAFIVRISQNIYLMRQLQSLLHVHYQNVSLLIKEEKNA
ncbi:hypothetical protein [Bacteroides sp.]